MVSQLAQPPRSLTQNLLDDRLAPSRDQIKQILRSKIQNTLSIAKGLPPQLCLQVVRERLISIQRYCGSVGKTFIMVEEAIACDQFSLGGLCQDTATLFRGPDEKASVAICVTRKGSLLHRNDSDWTVYRNAGDVFVAGLEAGETASETPLALKR
ncbi:MAG: hypothetical protein ACFB5Z_20585 [Elainellaceae cyanobacterium]